MKITSKTEKITPQLWERLSKMVQTHFAEPKEYLFCEVRADAVEKKEGSCSNCGKSKTIAVMTGEIYVICDENEIFFPLHTKLAKKLIKQAIGSLAICDDCKINFFKTGKLKSGLTIMCDLSEIRSIDE